MDIENRLIIELKNYFQSDQRRIDHALKVLEFAKKIQLKEGGSKTIIIPAAILHDVGIKKGEQLHKSNAPKYQEAYGPEIAKEILEKLKLVNEDEKTHICRIIGSHHSAGVIDTIEFRIVWDADWLVNLTDEYKNKTKKTQIEIVNKIFKTSAGKELALAKVENNNL